MLLYENMIKKGVFQLDDFGGVDLFCKDNLFNYIISNLEISNTNYVLVVKCDGFDGTFVFRSNYLFSYTSLITNIDHIIEEFFYSYCNLYINNICSSSGLKRCDIFNDIRLVSHEVSEYLICLGKLVQERLFCVISNTEDIEGLISDSCTVTIYFIPIDNYTDECLDNIVNGYDR